MTSSGVPSFASTSLNKRLTSSIFELSHLYKLALVLAPRSSSFSIFRAASATSIPKFAHCRASDALKPAPAPTIKTERVM